MLSLIIDTSTDQQLVALAEKTTLLDLTYLPCKTQQSRLILPSILAFLKKRSKTLKNLQYISTGIGPGAFTGTRCGVMIAKSLAFGLKIPIIPFCSLSLFTPDSNGKFLSATDAKSDYLYLQKGERKTGKIIFEKPFISKIQNLNGHLEPRTLLISPNNFIPHKCAETKKPNPLPLLPLHYALYNAKKYSHPHEVEVLYLRSP